MRHLHALARSLASSAIALLSAGLCAPAGAQPSYRASHDGAIAEFAPPRRESFDRLIVQLPPLVPVRRSEKATASPAAPAVAAAAAPAAPAVRDTAPSVTPARADAPEAKPAAAPTAPVEAAEAPVASAAAASAVAVPAAPLAIEPAESYSAPADAAVESAPVGQAPEAPAAAAPEAPAAEEVKTEAAEAIAPSAEAAPTAAPTPARLLETTDDQESGGLGWAALVIVALLALGGFVAAKRMKARREKSMSAAEPASRPAPVAPAAAAPAPRMSRVAGILGMARAKLGPAVRALLQRLRNRRGDAKADPAAEPQAAADWARIGATLRARTNAPVDPVATPAAGETLPRDTVDTAAPRAEARRWEQDREDGVELLEPGSVGARSLVMNARRKLQAAGER